MFAVTTPPAVHASFVPCDPSPKPGLNVGGSDVRFSPDCRWALVFKSDAGPPPAFLLAKPLEDDTAAVIDMTKGTERTRFEMVRDAYPHWLADGRHLIVNYYEGSGSTIPLAFDLTQGAGAPINLAEVVLRPSLQRAGITDPHSFGINRWLYHYYVTYMDDGPAHVTVSAQLWYTPHGREGEGIVKCYVYSIDKATFRHYHFVREVTDEDACPGNDHETW